MVVHLSTGLNRSEFVELVNRLEAETFADGCVISEIEPLDHPEERKIRIQLPNTQHGVLLKADSIDAELIEWAIEELRLSLRPQ
ncbi:MAG: hypothetical protein ACYCY8_12250 [Burkholderiales bacterium]